MQGKSGENRGHSPLEPLQRRRWPVSGDNPVGGGQGSVGFVAFRRCIHQFTFLLASHPSPLGLPVKANL